MAISLKPAATVRGVVPHRRDAIRVRTSAPRLAAACRSTVAANSDKQPVGPLTINTERVWHRPSAAHLAKRACRIVACSCLRQRTCD